MDSIESRRVVEPVAEMVSGEGDADERDVLITRIINRDDAVSWERFTEAAGREPGAWRELAAAQRNHAMMCRAVLREVRAADAVELPTHSAAEAGASIATAWSMRLSRWGGWAVAAAVTFAWVGTMIRAEHHASSMTAGPTGEGWIPVKTADDALSAYRKLGLDSGRVVGEVPDLVMVDSKPSGTGQGYEIVYIRQFVERTVVPDLYRFSTDERGNSVPVRVSRPGAPGDGL